MKLDKTTMYLWMWTGFLVLLLAVTVALAYHFNQEERECVQTCIEENGIENGKNCEAYCGVSDSDTVVIAY